MTSEPIRDPRGDHLLTPQNCAGHHRLPGRPGHVDQVHGPGQLTIAPLRGRPAGDHTWTGRRSTPGRPEFKQAVWAAGRRKLIMVALWTEACLTFPSLMRCVRGMRSTR
jgi:hypothetical protein